MDTNTRIERESQAVNSAESVAGLKAERDELLRALRSIEQMSLDAKRGPAHVAKLTLDMMAGVAQEAIAKAAGISSQRGG